MTAAAKTKPPATKAYNNKIKETFKQIAKTHKISYTKERLQIIDLICNKLKSHFDIPQLKEQLEKNNIPISKSTIYRTINILVDFKILKKLSFDNQQRARYELDVERKHHDHMICTNCGLIIEFVDPTIEKRQSLICKKHSFIETDHTLQIFGICKNCAKKSQPK